MNKKRRLCKVLCLYGGFHFIMPRWLALNLKAKIIKSLPLIKVSENV